MTGLEKDAQALRRALEGDGDEVTVTMSRKSAELLVALLEADEAGPDAATERQHAAVADVFAMQNGWD